MLWSSINFLFSKKFTNQIKKRYFIYSHYIPTLFFKQQSNQVQIGVYTKKLKFPILLKKRLLNHKFENYN